MDKWNDVDVCALVRRTESPRGCRGQAAPPELRTSAPAPRGGPGYLEPITPVITYSSLAMSVGYQVSQAASRYLWRWSTTAA